jgi:uncharacterized protein DUF2188
VTQRFDRKDDAITRGVQIASGAAPHGQLIIKRADGTIDEQRTYACLTLIRAASGNRRFRRDSRG